METDISTAPAPAGRRQYRSGPPLEISLAAFGTELKDGAEGERDLPQIERALGEWPAGLAILDFTGVEFIGYAYARQAIVPCLQGLLAGRYPGRWMILRYEGEDYATRLEGLAQALAEYRLTAMLSHLGGLRPLGYLDRDQPFEGKRAQVKKRKMLAILGLLAERGALHTNEVAARLDLTLPNCNYLLAELEKQRLVERTKESSPSGGPIYRNQLAPPDLGPQGGEED